MTCCDGWRLIAVWPSLRAIARIARPGIPSPHSLRDRFSFPDGAQRAEMWRRVFLLHIPTEGLQIDRLARLRVSEATSKTSPSARPFWPPTRSDGCAMQHLLSSTGASSAKLETPLADAGRWRDGFETRASAIVLGRGDRGAHRADRSPRLRTGRHAPSGEALQAQLTRLVQNTVGTVQEMGIFRSRHSRRPAKAAESLSTEALGARLAQRISPGNCSSRGHTRARQRKPRGARP